MLLYLHGINMERFKRILKRVFIAIAAIFGLAALTVFIILRFYEDDVVGYIIKQINSRLATKASVASVDLTYWETFPNASLKFQDVYIEETLDAKDTLFYAEKLYLEFSLLDVFRKNYNIKEITADEGKVFMRLNKKGESNWNIFKETGDSTSAFAVKLERVDAMKMHVVYEDRKSQFFLDYLLDAGEFSGDFQSGDFDLSMDFRGRMTTLISGYDEYVADRTVEAKGNLAVHSSEGKYAVEGLQVRIDDVPLLISGDYVSAGKGRIQLAVVGDDLTMQSVLNILPSAYKEQVQSYNAKGQVSFEGTISGAVGTGQRPDIKASFDINEGSIEHDASGTTFEHIRMRGTYLMGAKQDQLTFSEFSGALQAGIISGEGVVYNLKSPNADLRLRADVSLADLKQFLNWDTLSICEGRIVAEMVYKGTINGKSKADFNSIQASGKAELSDARLQLKGSSRLFERVGAKVNFDNRDAHVQQLIGVVNGSDFAVNGSLNNLLPFLLDTSEKLHVEAVLKSNYIDFGQLIESTETSNEEYVFSLPERMTFVLNSRVEKFKFEAFSAEEVNGIVKYNGVSLDVDPVSFKTSEGTFLAQLRLKQNMKAGFDLICSANFKDINIQKMFVSFGNFGQTFITDKHLRGKARATVQLEAPMSAALKLDMDKLHVLLDIGISNGELIGLESLQAIGDYMKKNKWIAPFVNEEAFNDRMKHIRFSDLENVIEIKNRRIIIPNMEIHSSAMDISAHGEHGFDQSIDYTIGFRLRDVLIRKQAEQVADDGLGKQMYIYMRGTTMKPEFGMDKDAAREERQQEIMREKNNVKALLKEEFGLFKQDASVGGYIATPEKKETITTIEWEELDSAPKKEETKQEERPKLQDASVEKKDDKQKKLPKWLQEKE